MTQAVLIDCDPGYDDAAALILAAGSPALELVGVTTVAGNQTLEKVTGNARRILKLLGSRAPVAAGARSPLLSDAPRVCPEKTARRRQSPRKNLTTAGLSKPRRYL